MTPHAFLRERILRIVPLYWLATAVMVFGALTGLFPNLRISAGYVAASLFFIPARSPSDGQIWPVLVQSSTLNYEMFFYLLFATLLLPSRWRMAALSLLLVGCVALGAWASPENPIAFTFSRPLLLEFLAGVVIGAWWLSEAPSRRIVGSPAVMAAIAGFAAIAISGQGFHTSSSLRSRHCSSGESWCSSAGGQCPMRRCSPISATAPTRSICGTPSPSR